MIAGLRAGLRGLVVKELRTRSRGWRATWVLTGYLLALTLAVSGFLSLMLRDGGSYPSGAGLMLFYTLAFGSVLLLAFITPALTTGAISGERERRTLELLLVTRASALGIACGKLLGSLLYVVFLLVASLPAFALVSLFGGVRLRYLASVLCVALVTAVSYAALGLLCSAVFRRTAAATVVAYLGVLLLVAVLPLGLTVTGLVISRTGTGATGRDDPGATSMALGLSPLTSLYSILVSGSRGEDEAGGDPVPITHSVSFVPDRSGAGGERVVHLSPWVYHFAFSGALTVASLLVTTVAISPVKPWRTWRLRRRLARRGTPAPVAVAGGGP